MSKIGIRAVSETGGCVDVEINSNNCSAVVVTGGLTMKDDGTVVDGVYVKKHGKRWRVSVPNCGYPSTVMWVTCVEQGLQFTVTRGSNLRPASHGFLGKYYTYTVVFEYNIIVLF